MIVLVKLTAVVAVFVLLVMRRANLGASILGVSLLLGLLFGMAPADILRSGAAGASHPTTLDLVGTILLILVLGRLMGETGNLRDIAASLEQIIPDRRVSIVLPPALIGLIPMPGGAMLSAPMVEEAGRAMRLTPEMKTFINYWFRHVWEYFWPLYPGLLIAAAVLEVPLPRIMATQWPLTVVALGAGTVLGILRLPPSRAPAGTPGRRLAGALALAGSIWPIALVLVLALVVRLPLVLALGATLVAVLVIARLPWGRLGPIILRSFEWRTLLVVVAVMVFKEILTDSGAVSAIPPAFEALGVPAPLLLVLAPFTVGILTGVNQAYVGVAFPMLIPLMGGSDPDLGLVMLAYGSGFVGVILSPVHLCLLLTKDYYGARYPGVYRHLIPAALVVLAGVFALLAVHVYL